MLSMVEQEDFTGSLDNTAPLVSAIVPTLNAAATLQMCLESVCHQTYPRVEILIVDGGSTDSTREIAKSREVIFVESSLRRSSARRAGANAARGEYLLFLDADQTADLDLIDQCVKLCERGEFQAVKIPEVDEITGVWGQCWLSVRNLASVEDLSYPRFFMRESYLELGGHTENLEDYMEDRSLYIKFRAVGGRWTWAKSRLHNLIGSVNPIQFGIKGARAAVDSSGYYRIHRKSRETLASVIVPRIRRLIAPTRTERVSVVVALALPIFILVALGPRLVCATVGQIAARLRPSG